MSHQTLKKEARKIWETKAEDFTYEDIDQIIDRTITHTLSQVDEVLEKKKNWYSGEGNKPIREALSDAQSAVKLINK